MISEPRQRRNPRRGFTLLELILAGSSINFMAFNRFTSPDPVTGQVFTLFIMAVAAAEAFFNKVDIFIEMFIINILGLALRPRK